MDQFQLIDKLKQSVTKKPPGDFPSSSFRCFYLDTFFFPEAGLLFPRKSEISGRQWQKLEEWFARLGRRSILESKTPFVCCYPRQFSPKTIECLKSRGWQKSPGHQNINTWSKASPFSLPKDMSATIAHPSNSHEIKPHMEMVSRIFAAPAIGRLLQNWYRKSDDNILITNIRSKSGKLVGTGTVIWNGKYGALFNGSVDPRYRKQGVWKALLGLRQVASREAGVEHWYLTTSTPAIMKKADVCTKFEIWRKLN